MTNTTETTQNTEETSTLSAETIQAEYEKIAMQVGHKNYQKEVLTSEIPQLYGKMLDLNKALADLKAQTSAMTASAP